MGHAGNDFYATFHRRLRSSSLQPSRPAVEPLRERPLARWSMQPARNPTASAAASTPETTAAKRLPAPLIKSEDESIMTLVDVDEEELKGKIANVRDSQLA